MVIYQADERRRSERTRETLSSDEEEDDDALLDSLENDLDMQGFREKRIEELRQLQVQAQARQLSNSGRLTTVTIEKELITRTAKARLSIVHFFHVDFRRCKIMDKHLTTLAERYPDTVFLRIDVANAPFLVNKLQVKVLPCVFCFIDGANKDQIVGFEGLANKETDDFSTAELELRLKQSGVISAIKQATVHSILGLDKTRSDDLDLD